MGSIKVIIDDGVERKFRQAAMKKYGYGKGALSDAAETALAEWSSREEEGETMVVGIENPVAAIEGLLKQVRGTSVELQHEASRIRVRGALAKRSR